MNVKHAELVSLTHQASAAAEHELSSCCSRSQSLGSVARGARAQLPHGMWDLPVPEIKPMSPALAGGFLTTVLPGMPEKNVILNKLWNQLEYFTHKHFSMGISEASIYLCVFDI